MTISTEEAIRELMNRGFTPVTMPNEDDPTKTHVFIEKEVVWDKLFSSLEENLAEERRESEEVENFYQSIKHKNWIKRLITAHNPKLDWVQIEGKLALAVIYPQMKEKGGKLPRLEDNLRKWMFLTQVYVTDLLERFEL